MLRVYADVILVNTMLWPDEVREPDFPFLREPPPQVRPQELALAGSLIDSLSDPVFDPANYKDEYREALQALIEAKIAGQEVTTLPPGSAGAPAIDLMSALSASVEAASRGGSAPATQPQLPGPRRPRAELPRADPARADPPRTVRPRPSGRRKAPKPGPA